MAVGEALIDFTALDVNVPVGEATAFARNPGGGPANVAVAIARLGGHAGMIGCVGGDPFGEFLLRTLADYGVDTRHARAIPGYSTTLAFVARYKGEPDYFFVRNPGADVMLSSEHVANADIDGQTVLHFVSNALAALPIRHTLLELMARTKSAGGWLSFDVNLRPAFWSGSDALEQAKHWCEEAFAQADIVKLNRDELLWLSEQDDRASDGQGRREPGAHQGSQELGAHQGADAGGENVRRDVAMDHEAAMDRDVATDHEAAMDREAATDHDVATDAEVAALRALADRIPGICVCTLGARGAMVLHREWGSPVMVQAPRMQVVDTTGAGDAFIGALLFRLSMDSAGVRNLQSRSADEWAADLYFAIHASAISVTRQGAMAAMPTLAEVQQQMAAKEA